MRAGRRFRRFFKVGDGATAYDLSFSLALMGAGHLVGLSVGIAGLFGVLIGWGVAVPYFTAVMPDPSMSLDAHVIDIWKHQVRFIGAGAIAVAAIWTLIKLTRPVIGGLVGTISSARSARAATGRRQRPRPFRQMDARADGCVLRHHRMGGAGFARERALAPQSGL